jgi:glutaredoxin
VDVLREGSRLPEMLKHSGSQRRVPVIVHGGKVEIGFEGHS